ncbi:MAG: 4Fe-4S dicluster domain-containing protein [Candidatus Sericytochromatia bacterium]|nr:4Fe-4S dicluster domain-containing protein [Candidatus Tanganyikabacteria bacterium]
MALHAATARPAALAAAARDAGLLDGQGRPLHLRLAAAWQRVLVVPSSADPACPTDAVLWQHQATELLLALEVLAGCHGGARSRIEIALSSTTARLIDLDNLRPRLDGAGVLVLPDRYPAAATEHAWLARVGHAFPGWQAAAEEGVLVLDTVGLWQLGLRAGGHVPAPRILTCTDAQGAVRSWLLPLGSPLAPILEALPEGEAWAGGALSGRRLDAGEYVAADVHWIQALPRDHAATRHRRVPVDVALKRALSLCGTCTACTDWCPSADVPASGAAGHPAHAATGLVPHRLVRLAAHGQEGQAELLMGARHCGACGICSVAACPSEVNPAALLVALREGLVAGGVPRTAAPTGAPSRLTGALAGPAAHHFRLGEDALLERLRVRRPVTVPEPAAHHPRKIRIPLVADGDVPLAPLWPEDGQVKAGQPVALTPHAHGGWRLVAPISGRLAWSPGQLEVLA